MLYTCTVLFADMQIHVKKLMHKQASLLLFIILSEWHILVSTTKHSQTTGTFTEI